MQMPSVHHMTALETEPAEFIALVAAAGGNAVSLFAHQPGGATDFPLVTKDNLVAVRQSLADHAVRVANVDVLMLTPHSNTEDFLPALDMGAELGARGAVALVYDDDAARVIPALQALCEQAAQRDMGIAFEFTGFTPAWNSLAGAVELLSAVNHPHLKIALDVLHLVRSGSTIAEVAALSAGQVAHGQLCDGCNLEVTADYGREAASNRLLPGTGVFPLREFLAALPEGTPLDLEVPRPPTRPALERIRQALDGARQLQSQ
jgi:sugar phosphate isomerase/epimerase